MIVLTGASGFLGAHILQNLLASGYKVRAIIRANSDLSFAKRVVEKYGNAADWNKIDWFEADILDYFSLERAFEGATTVIHAAAMVSFWEKDRAQMYKVNVDGTANVVNACLYCKVKELVYISSIAALGRSDLDEPISEKTPWKNSPDNSWYALSKNAGEREVWRGTEEGLPAIILNPGVIIGYAEWNKSSGKIFSQIKKGIPYYTSGANGFVDVKDVCKALIALLQSEVRNERFVLVSETVPFKKMIEVIASELKVKAPQKEISPLLLKIAVKLSGIWAKISGKEPILSSELAKTSQKQSQYLNTKIQETIHFKFTPVEDSLRRTAQEFEAEF
ncbi:MAG TPA: NAD-dependent epimerase/dehydratase family protein [Bacteroidia bacterium]